jgi:hypothetical protein
MTIALVRLSGLGRPLATRAWPRWRPLCIRLTLVESYVEFK